MSRYSGRHTVLHAGAFMTPLIPLAIISAMYDHAPYKASPWNIALLWVVGLVISYSLIVVHELGHWFAARSVGMEIADITIGHWRRLASFSIGRATATLRAAPSTGYVTLKTSPKLFSAPRMIVFFLAGVVAEGCFILIFALAVSAPDDLYSFSDLFIAFCRINIVFVGSYHTFLNLLPRQGFIGGEMLASDGLQLMQLWKLRRERPAQRQFLAELQQVDALCLNGEFPAALELAQSLASQHSDNIGLWQFIGTLHEKLGELDKTESILRELIKRPALPLSKLAELLDSLSCLVLYHGRSHLLAQAEAWINEATRYAPHAITLKGTRGGILIELGRVDEGILLLREVVKRSECSADQTFSAAYLAKAYAAKNCLEESQQWMAKAQTLNPEHRHVKKIAGELSLPALRPTECPSAM